MLVVKLHTDQNHIDLYIHQAASGTHNLRSVKKIIYLSHLLRFRYIFSLRFQVKYNSISTVHTVGGCLESEQILILFRLDPPLISREFVLPTFVHPLDFRFRFSYPNEMVLFTNFPPPTEGVKIELNNTRAFVGSRELGAGCLYIAERFVLQP